MAIPDLLLRRRAPGTDTWHHRRNILLGQRRLLLQQIYIFSLNEAEEVCTIQIAARSIITILVARRPHPLSAFPSAAHIRRRQFAEL